MAHIYRTFCRVAGARREERQLVLIARSFGISASELLPGVEGGAPASLRPRIGQPGAQPHSQPGGGLERVARTLKEIASEPTAEPRSQPARKKR